MTPGPRDIVPDTCGRRHARLASAALLACAFCSWNAMAQAAGGTLPEPTRGVRLLDPGDEMLPVAPFPELKPGFVGRVAPPLEKVRVAVADGPTSRLDGLVQHAAPFEVVAETENPDIVWNAASSDVRAGPETIAYGIGAMDLPAVIDRVAAVRAIAKFAAERPQPIKLVSGPRAAHKGDKLEIEVGNIAQRALVLFDINGDGTVQALYPLGGDERIIRAPSFRWRFQTSEPFGADLIVAVSAAQPMDALEQGLKEISHYRSAGEVLKLLALEAPPEARIGALTLSSSP